MANKMKHMQVESLDQECHILTRYLIRQVPSEYVRKKYREAHGTVSGLENVQTERFDRFLLRIAVTHEYLATIADSYARILFKTASIRRKCVLLAAILECSPRIHEEFETEERNGNIVLWANMTARVVGFTVVACLAVTMLWPFHVLLGGGRGKAD